MSQVLRVRAVRLGLRRLQQPCTSTRTVRVRAHSGLVLVPKEQVSHGAPNRATGAGLDTKDKAAYLAWHQGNKVFFRSLGCPRNWVDTEVMLGIMLKAGYEPTDKMKSADYIVVNTCGFLEAARNESTDAIEETIRTKKKNCKLVVTGCLINLHKDLIQQRYPEIDYVLGSGAVDKVLDAITSNEKGEMMPTRKSFLENGEVPRMLATSKHFAYLKIAEGCRKRCSFCIIPKIKGHLQSKPIDQIQTELHALLQQGVKEIILIAQDLGDYGKDRKIKNGLVELLKSLLQSTDQKFWLRLMYLYPDEVTPEIIEIIKSDRRICRYVDMPLQHINDEILKAMKRKTSRSDIIRTLTLLREEIPGMVIRTSLMVGFPGETEEQFQELVKFVKEFRLDQVGVFQYSNEKEAWSSRLPNHVDEETKIRRYDELMRAQMEVVREKNEQMVKERKRLSIVVDGFHPETKELLVGRYDGQCPDIDNQVIIDDWGDDENILPEFGKIYAGVVTDSVDYDLVASIQIDGAEFKAVK